MEPLFKISQEYTFKEYKKFTNAVLKWNRIIIGVFFWFAFLSGILLVSFNGFSTEGCFLILFPILYVILRKLSIKRYYNSNKILKDITEDSNQKIIIPGRTSYMETQLYCPKWENILRNRIINIVKNVEFYYNIQRRIL